MPVRSIKNTSYETKLDRHTTEEIAQLNPEQGALVFDTTTKTQKIYTGTEWVDLQSPEDWRVQADLFVSGNTNVEGIYANGYSEFYEDAYFDGAVDIQGVVAMDSDTNIGGGLFVDGYTEFYDDAYFEGSVEFNSGIDVSEDFFLQQGGMVIQSTTVSALPAASALVGAIRTVSDASAISYRGVATGGGSDFALVMSDGTNWIYH